MINFEVVTVLSRPRWHFISWLLAVFAMIACCVSSVVLGSILFASLLDGTDVNGVPWGLEGMTALIGMGTICYGLAGTVVYLLMDEIADPSYKWFE